MFSDPAKIVSQLKLRSGEVVADFGVGSGHYTLAAAKIVGNHGEVYAFDVQTELLTRVGKLAAEKGLFNVKVMATNFELENSTKLKNEAVDFVIIANILFQLKNKENILKEAQRILKKSGKLLIIDWSESFGGVGPQPADVVSKKTMEQLADKTNFSLLSSIDAGDYHYGLVFKK